MNKVFEIGVLGFGDKNEVVEECSVLEIKSTFYLDLFFFFWESI